MIPSSIVSYSALVMVTNRCQDPCFQSCASWKLVGMMLACSKAIFALVVNLLLSAKLYCYTCNIINLDQHLSLTNVL